MILLLLFAVVPVELAIKDQFEICELNHFYDEKGKFVFDQVIFHDNDNVCAWCLLRSGTPCTKDYIWSDGLNIRHIKYKMFKETWTQYDPELVAREKLPKERRKGFSDGLGSRQKRHLAPSN